ncbi:hypothetical protein BJX61DRAFT_511973 [Aspergillus egyptiacus]|nr:hypothetical protein BJX61DRAFT_511973 [Aspergillus egyptiacus]
MDREELRQDWPEYSPGIGFYGDTLPVRTLRGSAPYKTPSIRSRRVFGRIHI